MIVERITPQMLGYLISERQHNERVEIRKGIPLLILATGEECYLEPMGMLGGGGLCWRRKTEEGHLIFYRWLRVIKQ